MADRASSIEQIEDTEGGGIRVRGARSIWRGLGLRLEPIAPLANFLIGSLQEL